MKENFDQSSPNNNEKLEGAVISNVPEKQVEFKRNAYVTPEVSTQLVADIANKKEEVEAIFDADKRVLQVESPDVLTSSAYATQNENKTAFKARKEERLSNIGTGRTWFKRLALAGGLFLAGLTGTKAADGGRDSASLGDKPMGKPTIEKVTTTNMSPLEKVKAMIAARKAADTTPKLNMADELAAINAGKKGGMSQEEAQKLHDANQPGWEKHVNEIGYEKVPTKN